MSKTIVHSEMTFDEAVSGSEAPKEVLNALVLLNVEYYNFEGFLCRGQIVVHQSLSQDVSELFRQIKEKRFPVATVIPIVKYNWNDDLSMTDNNSSGFNYRFIKGTATLSNHSLGRAIDINPVQNPYLRRLPNKKDIEIDPPGAEYNPKTPGTILRESFIVTFLKSKGWSWGGDWADDKAPNRVGLKDYQHFEKRNHSHRK